MRTTPCVLGAWKARSVVNPRLRWALGLSLLVLLLLFGVWRAGLGAPAWGAPLRLYTDHAFLHARLRALRWLAPAAFILIQAAQVVISPIPGEATGFLGGYLFGLTLGFVYSMIGLALGTMAAFGIGRWLGAAMVARHVPARVLERFGFLLKAEGAVLAFVIYLIPGFPKDIVSYLFGMSPMPAWVFLATATLGRIPGTWVLSAQGARVATGQYVQVAVVTALAAAVAIPLYYYRHTVLQRLRRSMPRERGR